MKKALIFLVIILGLAGGFYYLSEQSLEKKHVEIDVAAPRVSTAPDVVKSARVPMPDLGEAQKREEGEVPMDLSPLDMVEQDFEELELEPVEDVEIAEHPELEEKYEALLNSILDEVSKTYAEYQAQRAQMEAMIAPKNLEDPKMVAANAQKMVDVTSKIREKARSVMDAYEGADAKVQALVEDLSEAEQKVLITKWDSLVSKHAGWYENFFEKEEAMAKSHAALMRFYYTRLGSYEYDEERDMIVFENAEDQRFSRVLLTQVNRMKRTQNMAKQNH